MGVEIVKPITSLSVIEIKAHHRDHYDGTGHNQTTRNEEIPLGAKIIAVADNFDAMTSNRLCCSAMSQKQGADEIKQGVNTQFDPVVVAAFLKIIKD
ncbi:MAG: HD-GYP domain-containing protein [Dehalococcoidales bacterium]